jgi:hypothetical protein
MDFATYARLYRNAVAFAPDFERAEEQVFAASLNSFRALARSVDSERNADNMTLKIEAGFVETMTPNAFADFHDGVHCIGMHQALMATIMDLSLYLFTQSELFSNIGNAAAEDSPRYAGNDAPGLYLLKMTMAGGVVDPAIDHVRVPKDAERHIAAVYMAMLMARSVWFHELAHCTNGHVLFLRSLGQSAGVNEVAAPLDLVGFKNDAKQAHDHRALRHALELDADVTALLSLIDFQFEGRENIPGLLAYDDETRLDMTLLGAFLMTWLFEEYQRFMDSQHGLTHPDPAIRLHYLASSVSAQRPELQVNVARALQTLNALSTQLPGLARIAASSAGAAPSALDQTELFTMLAPFRFSFPVT